MISFFRSWGARRDSSLAKTSGDRRLLRELPEDHFGQYPKPPSGFPLIDPAVLIDQHRDLISKIRASIGTAPPGAWDTYFMDAIVRYSRYVHLLPASEVDHHRGPGGLLRHGLEVAHRTMLHGYSHVPDMANYPSDNRRFESRWAYACFISGLCHDIGKAVTDLLVTDEGGKNVWSPYTESLLDWCLRLDIERYYINYRPNRHKRHSAFNVKVTHLIIKPEADLFLSEGSDKLIGDVTDAIMASPSSLAPLVRYVMKADAESCEHDRKTNPPTDSVATHTASLPAHKYILEGIRRCINDGVWKPNHADSPLFIVNRAMYLIWPRAAAQISERMHSKSGVPLNPDVMAELMLERQYIVEFTPDPQTHSMYWSILPQPIETAGSRTPLKAICFPKASAFFEIEVESVAAKMFNPALVAKASRSGTATEVPVLVSFRAINPAGLGPPSEANEGIDTPPGGSAAAPEPGHRPASAATAQLEHPSAPADNIARMNKPASDAAALTLRPATPEEDSSQPPMSDEDYAHYSRSMPSEADLQAMLGMGSEAATHKRAPEAPSPTPPKAIRPKSAPAKLESRGKGGVNAALWFKRSEHGVGPTLVAFAERLVESADRPERHLIARHQGLVVLQYPEAIADLGIVPRTMVQNLRSAGWLSDEISIAPIKQGVVFPRSIIFERTISQRLLELLDGVDIPEKPDLEAAKQAAKRMRTITSINDEEDHEADTPHADAKPRLLASVIGSTQSVEPTHDQLAARRPPKPVPPAVEIHADEVVTQPKAGGDSVPKPEVIDASEVDSAATDESVAIQAPQPLTRQQIVKALRAGYQNAPDSFTSSVRKTTVSAPEAYVLSLLSAHLEGVSQEVIRRSMGHLGDIRRENIDGVPSYRFNVNLVGGYPTR